MCVHTSENFIINRYTKTWRRREEQKKDKQTEKKSLSDKK